MFVYWDALTHSGNGFVSLGVFGLSTSPMRRAPSCLVRTWSACFPKQNKFGTCWFTGMAGYPVWQALHQTWPPIAVEFHSPSIFFWGGGRFKKTWFPSARFTAFCSVLSFVMEKGAVVQMGADGTHHSGIFNTIGWAETVSQEHWAVFLSWPQRTSVMPRAGRSEPPVSRSQRGSRCLPSDRPAGISLNLCWKFPCCAF